MLSDHSARQNGSTADPAALQRAGADRYQCSFSAEPGAVRNALRKALARFARSISADDAAALELALAEVLNNVVEHGYAGLAPGSIELSLIRDKTALQCLVVDQGHPMQGSRLPKGDMQAVADEVNNMPEGGWGWALIRALTTDLSYARRDGCNRLTFSVPLNKP